MVLNFVEIQELVGMRVNFTDKALTLIFEITIFTFYIINTSKI